ncbi:hypothetical protein TD95_003728 [Thielaviopsis punctulata]|uniref:Protein BNI4 n=1 Tax=Thielaviopsis punctulata TaxID=72032 RepID=A0A0F4ZE61_9PEZI|nr:hypothetical protein TD95_003728 [Thielaviopsis punctulata]
MLQHSHSSSQSQLMAQNHRNSFHAASIPVNMQPAYRPVVAPIQPYAFTATPSLHAPTSQRHQSSRTAQQLPGNVPRTSEVSRARMTSPVAYASGSSKRDSISSLSMVNLQANSQASTAPSRPQPDRYRRGSSSGQQKPGVSPIAPVGTNMSVNGHMYHHTNSSDTRIASRHHRGSSVDNTASHDVRTNPEEIKRMRRRSIQTLDFNEFQSMAPPSLSEFRRGSDSEVAEVRKMEAKKPKTLRLVAPMDMRSRSGSFESASSSNRSAPTNSTQSSVQSSSSSTSRNTDNDKPEFSIPPRGSSNMDAMKRAPTPSPLSGNAKMAKSADKAAAVSTQGAASSASKSNTAASSSQTAPAKTDSPAAQKLAAINQGGKGKTKTSRLRRALSFGSMAEFRRVGATSAQNQQTQEQDDVVLPLPSGRPAANITRPQTAGGGTLRNQPSLDNVDEAEQERIAKKQEASGLGNNIYGPRIFGGSTDNLSISSTASSASVMIRKMGRGMKRGGRSLVGLFRPKSMISTSLDSSSGVTELTMVNAEAERQRSVQQNSQRIAEEPARTASLTSQRAGSSGTDSSSANKNTEAQISQPKGILKRRGGSPNRAVTESDGPGLMLPEIPAISDSPNSSAPSTPNDDGHKRVGGVAIGNEDYFVTALKLRQDGAGSTTPRQAMKRNATFSPRIVFHDTWPSQEYDRRGEIATCNRLTPLLAQQIKEELNSFKMTLTRRQEMEVHENSKIYTHFF